MSSSKKFAAEPLLKGVSQFEVDFVIPKLGVDLPLGIDPFLLFKSRDPVFKKLHDDIIRVFSEAVDRLKANRQGEVSQLLQFPEVSEVGLGYTTSSKRGSGIGSFLSDLIVDTLHKSPLMLERGLKHIEELQLVSVGIGADRISDITANIIKMFLIEYTQKQCGIWDIPIVSGVPVEHIFDVDRWDWVDMYCDLPVNPIDNSAILLVPRRIVRSLPWINYGDFVKLEFASFLRASATKAKGDNSGKGFEKKEIVAVSRKEIDRVDRYITKKEESSFEAQPSSVDDGMASFKEEADLLKRRLAAIPTGRERAADYQKAVLEVLNFLFMPELIDGEMEVETADGTERRDIIFTNDSDQTFWNYIRNEHSALLLMFEVKNSTEVHAPALNQTATYLGDRLGRIGFIVSRLPLGDSQTKKAFSIYNDSQPRKIILFLSDRDLEFMLDIKVKGGNPMRHIQQLYRSFRTSVQ